MNINFLGDVYLDKPYSVKIALEYFIFNLEYPLSVNGIPALSKINLGQSRSYIEDTFNELPVAVNLANNHIMDYGEESFDHTIKYLEDKKIKYFGAGTKANNYNNPLLLDFNQKQIAVLGYSCKSTNAVFGSGMNKGSAELDSLKIIEDIKSVIAKVDYIILQLHWGDEEIKYPKPDDIIKARAFIDAGADLIIGHHAHVIQSVEEYKGKNIYYGIGNFIFPDIDVPAQYDGTKFKKRFIKKQDKQNLESIIINLNDRFDVSHKISLFDGITVKLHNRNLSSRLIKTELFYKIYTNYYQRKGTITRFYRKPKWPSFRQIKIFLGIK
jgi:poly-gamma-glutamate synthesis protein (capsule biosynthesis protein)